MATPYGGLRIRLWGSAALAAAGYGVFLVATALRLPAGAELTGQFPGQPWVKAAMALLAAASTVLLIVFWPHLGADGLTVPVTVYVAVLAAMAIAAVLAGLPTLWTAAGAVLFTVSDSMIGIDRFLLGSEALALAVWWCYAAAQLAITAGLLFGRPALSAPPGRPTG